MQLLRKLCQHTQQYNNFFVTNIFAFVQSKDCTETKTSNETFHEKQITRNAYLVKTTYYMQKYSHINTKDVLLQEL